MQTKFNLTDLIPSELYEIHYYLPAIWKTWKITDPCIIQGIFIRAIEIQYPNACNTQFQFKLEDVITDRAGVSYKKNAQISLYTQEIITVLPLYSLDKDFISQDDLKKLHTLRTQLQP